MANPYEIKYTILVDDVKLITNLLIVNKQRLFYPIKVLFFVSKISMFCYRRKYVKSKKIIFLRSIIT